MISKNILYINQLLLFVSSSILNKAIVQWFHCLLVIAGIKLKMKMMRQPVVSLVLLATLALVCCKGAPMESKVGTDTPTTTVTPTEENFFPTEEPPLPSIPDTELLTETTPAHPAEVPTAESSQLDVLETAEQATPIERTPNEAEGKSSLDLEESASGFYGGYYPSRFLSRGGGFGFGHGGFGFPYARLPNHISGFSSFSSPYVSYRHVYPAPLRYYGHHRYW